MQPVVPTEMKSAPPLRDTLASVFRLRRTDNVFASDSLASGSISALASRVDHIARVRELQAKSAKDVVDFDDLIMPVCDAMALGEEATATALSRDYRNKILFTVSPGGADLPDPADLISQKFVNPDSAAALSYQAICAAAIGAGDSTRPQFQEALLNIVETEVGALADLVQTEITNGRFPNALLAETFRALAAGGSIDMKNWVAIIGKSDTDPAIGTLLEKFAKDGGLVLSLPGDRDNRRIKIHNPDNKGIRAEYITSDEGGKPLQSVRTVFELFGVTPAEVESKKQELAANQKAKKEENMARGRQNVADSPQRAEQIIREYRQFQVPRGIVALFMQKNPLLDRIKIELLSSGTKQVLHERLKSAHADFDKWLENNAPGFGDSHASQNLMERTAAFFGNVIDGDVFQHLNCNQGWTDSFVSEIRPVIEDMLALGLASRGIGLGNETPPNDFQAGQIGAVVDMLPGILAKRVGSVLPGLNYTGRFIDENKILPAAQKFFKK